MRERVRPKNLINWLLDGEPFIEYRTRLDLMKQSEGDPKVVYARKRMIQDEKIQVLLNELTNWPGEVLSSHKSASQPFHKLSFIADIGLTKEDPSIRAIADKIFIHQSEEGPYQLIANVPKHYGGSGIDTWAWALCDAPIIVYSLTKFGYGTDQQVQKAVNYLAKLAYPNGWHCTVSKELGKFRGPGRKDDPCPYATLAMLKMLAQNNEWRHSDEANAGAECLLNLWQHSLELHPYMFFMGTDFRKLKAPFVWYDILHFLDVLSQFTWLKNDKRLMEILNLVESKTNAEGKYTPESEWKAWKGLDFAQKKEPSRWLTFLALRAIKRIKGT